MQPSRATRGLVNGMRGSYDKGVCPVCREPQPLSSTTGKVMKHKRSRDNPAGCAGHGQAPYREPKPKPGTQP